MPRGSGPMEFTSAQRARMHGPYSHAQLAREFGCSDMPVRRWRQRNGWAAPAKPALTPQDIMLFLPAGGAAKLAAEPKPVSGPLGTPGISTKDGASTVTTPAIAGLAAVTDAEAYLRERWGFAAEKWLCLSAVGNEWQGGDGEGGVTTYTQLKGSFRPIADIAAVLPRPAEWQGRRFPRAVSGARCGKTHQIVVMSDHQCPYHDEAKHAATCAMIRALQPARVCHLGDGGDYTNVSAHPDHEVVAAKVNECTDGFVAVLEDVRDVAPDARFEVLAGNHDVRPFREQLLRAERLAGMRSGNLRNSPGERLVDFRKLWRLDELGIELVEDPRGWKHAELDLVPGPKGLAAMHGYLTGDNVAAKSLASCGRSVIVGHTHRREHIFVWNKLLGFEQQAAVVGCSCETRGGGGKSFPDFVPNDRWTPGDIVVTVHPDGEFTIEHARWNGESLILGAQRWAP